VQHYLLKSQLLAAQDHSVIKMWAHASRIVSYLLPPSVCPSALTSHVQRRVCSTLTSTGLIRPTASSSLYASPPLKGHPLFKVGQRHFTTMHPQTLYLMSRESHIAQNMFTWTDLFRGSGVNSVAIHESADNPKPSSGKNTEQGLEKYEWSLF